MMSDILQVANEANAMTINNLLALPPIKRDGGHCPKCGEMTVQCASWLWCPNIGCDWGNELKLPTLITKWAVKEG